MPYDDDRDVYDALWGVQRTTFPMEYAEDVEPEDEPEGLYDELPGAVTGAAMGQSLAQPEIRVEPEEEVMEMDPYISEPAYRRESVKVSTKDASTRYEKNQDPLTAFSTDRARQEYEKRAKPYQIVASQAVEALNKQREGEIALNQQQARASQELADFNEEEARVERKLSDEANQRAQKRIENIALATEKVASMKVDPSRFWTENTTAGRTAGFLAAFIGGFLAPALGRDDINAMLDKAIDRDIDAQKTGINVAQKNVDNLKMLHSLGMDQAETESMRRGQERLLRKASLVSKLEAEKLSLQDPILQGKYDSMIAELRKGIIDEQQKIYQEAVQNEQIRSRQELARWQAVRDEKHRAFQRSQARKELEMKKAAQQGDGLPQNVFTSPVRQGYQVGTFQPWLNDAGKKEFAERYRGRAEMALAFNEMLKLQAVVGKTYRGPGRSHMQSDMEKRLRTQYETIRSTILKNISGAVVAKEEVERITKAVPPFESWLSGSSVANWQEYRDIVTDHQRYDNNTYLQHHAPGYNIEDEFIDPVTSGDPAGIPDALRNEARRTISQGEQPGFAQRPQDIVDAVTTISDLHMGAGSESERYAARDDMQEIGNELMGKVLGSIKNRHSMMKNADIAMGKTNAETRANIAQAVTDNKISGAEYDALMHEQGVIELYGPAVLETSKAVHMFGWEPSEREKAESEILLLP